MIALLDLLFISISFFVGLIFLAMQEKSDTFVVFNGMSFG
jgi:hypothetical protein